MLIFSCKGVGFLLFENRFTKTSFVFFLGFRLRAAGTLEIMRIKSGDGFPWLFKGILSEISGENIVLIRLFC